MTDTDTLPRGVRNNNPGNIRHGQYWQGLSPTQTDPSFCQFVDAQHGIRALGIVLLNYQALHGLKTVRQIIDRWAPPSDDNPTNAYAAFVASQMGVDQDAPIDASNAVTLKAMVCAIILDECAGYAYPDEVVKAGVAMALVAR